MRKFYPLAFLCFFYSLPSIGQSTYTETKTPSELPVGVLYQPGPGDGNSAGWLYPYGTKFTVNLGNWRNFELCTTAYPNGDLAFRQYNPTNSTWDSWRQIVMYDNNGRLNAKSIFVQSGDNILRFLPTNPGIEIGASTGIVSFWYSGIGFNTIRCGDILSAGKIGIGVDAPKNALDVKGTIRATEVKVVSDSEWADFVFKPDYQLKPLAEVEQFITTNGHLPEVPTAKEVEQNGVNLGEMNVKLLQKVEELTLYLIEQKKEIELLKQKLADKSSRE
jgi:hypothetical protein